VALLVMIFLGNPYQQIISFLMNPIITILVMLAYEAASTLSQPTLRRGCEKAKIDRPMRLSPREKTSGVATNIYLRKMLEKPKDEGLRILKMRVRET